jgi:amidase
VGYTWNPKNRLLSAGGSSGGEGAIVRSRASPVGFGSDIAGVSSQVEEIEHF